MRLNIARWTITACMGALMAAPMAWGNVIGIDDRKLLSDTEARELLGITKAEASKIRRSTGFIHCPGTRFNNPLTTSASLIHDAGVVVTNSHAFIDELLLYRSPLSSCYFQNQETPAQASELSFVGNDFKLVLNWMIHGHYNDFAVVRLVQGIVGASAFPMAQPVLKIGDPLLTVSAYQERPENPFDFNTPIVQKCFVRNVYGATAEYGASITSDCDVTNGGSGSVQLARVNGEWSAVSVVLGSGPPSNNGLSYDETNDLRRASYTTSVLVAGRLLKTIMDVSQSK